MGSGAKIFRVYEALGDAVIDYTFGGGVTIVSPTSLLHLSELATTSANINLSAITIVKATSIMTRVNSDTLTTDETTSSA